MNYIQQAYKGKKEWYHWMLTLFVVFVGWQFVGVIPLFVVASMHSASMSEFVNSGKDNFMTLGIDNNLFLFLMILMFIFGLISLFVSVKFIHKRNFTALVTSRKSIDWRRFWFAFLFWGIVSSGLVLADHYMAPEN